MKVCKLQEILKYSECGNGSLNSTGNYKQVSVLFSRQENKSCLLISILFLRNSDTSISTWHRSISIFLFLSSRSCSLMFLESGQELIVEVLRNSSKIDSRAKNATRGR